MDQHIVYVSHGADHTGATSDVNEAECLDWIPLTEVQQKISDGEIVSAGSVTGLVAVLLAKATGQF